MSKRKFQGRFKRVAPVASGLASVDAAMPTAREIAVLARCFAIAAEIIADVNVRQFEALTDLGVSEEEILEDLSSRMAGVTEGVFLRVMAKTADRIGAKAA